MRFTVYTRFVIMWVRHAEMTGMTLMCVVTERTATKEGVTLIGPYKQEAQHTTQATCRSTKGRQAAKGRGDSTGTSSIVAFLGRNGRGTVSTEQV